ncbi:neuropeptide-like precursor 1 isoform X3 [Cydia fagiglandana]|uniref:neuropeptide-like precursor 1 isoform X3 n=1 Tax=Cydia fagiglandana TaxID=1458189 RepID=UPI002FEE0E49
MREFRGMSTARNRGCLLLVAAVVLAFSSYIDQVVSMPALSAPNQWPTFPRRNIAALARAGYLRGSSAATFKRSISTLAKNGMLPTFRAPYDEADKQDADDGESHEKRNLASIARLRSYSAMKRNIQALARDGGYRGSGRAQYSQQADKRNVAALARNGMIHLHKKDMPGGDEYYFPFYQNPVEPPSDIDANEIYDWQQIVNPDMFPPLSQVYKRGGPMPQSEYENPDENDYAGYGTPSEMDDNWYFKRGSAGLPVLGMYRPTIGDQSTRTKRYILSLPDVIDRNDIHDSEDTENEDKRSVDDDDDVREKFAKRHIGSLARLGLLPSFRFSGGRYSRSGRARLLWPSQELYRKHSPDENFGIRQYIPSAEAEPDTDNADLPPPPVLAHTHPTGRLLHRPLDNDVPNDVSSPLPSPPNSLESFAKNRWQPNTKEIPKFYYFRSLKLPYHNSGKRYLLLPAVDNILLRKNYPNSSLPGRRKNQ